MGREFAEGWAAVFSRFAVTGSSGRAPEFRGHAHTPEFPKFQHPPVLHGKVGDFLDQRVGVSRIGPADAQCVGVNTANFSRLESLTNHGSQRRWSVRRRHNFSER